MLSKPTSCSTCTSCPRSLGQDVECDFIINACTCGLSAALEE